MGEGEIVEFNIETGPDGRSKAVNVTGPDGAPPQVRHVLRPADAQNRRITNV